MNNFINIIKNYIMPFIVGGIIVLGSTLISKKISPQLGGLFWGFPFSFIAIVILMWYQFSRKDRFDILDKYGSTVIPSNIILIIYLMTFIWAFRQYGKEKDGIWKALGIATLIWSIVVYIYYKSGWGELTN